MPVRSGGNSVLKRVFVAPDPGRARMRSAMRAVLGIGLAVVLCGLAGHSLVDAATGGLAVLLSLLTASAVRALLSWTRWFMGAVSRGRVWSDAC